MCRRIALVIGLVVAGVGALVLCAWRFNVVWPTSLLPGWATMKPNTSFSMLVLGLAMTCLARNAHRGWLTAIGRVLALAALIVGGLTVLSHLGLETRGLDTMLANPAPTVYPPGRSSPVTATLITLLACGTLVTSARPSSGPGGRAVTWLHRFFAGVSCGLGLASITGYMFGAQSLYASPGFETIALHSALCSISIAVGLFFLRPDLQPLRTILGDSAAGTSIRAGLPIALLALVVVHVFAALFYRLHFTTASVLFGLELVAQLAIVGFAFSLSARSVQRSADAADLATEEVRQSEARYRSIWDSAPVLVWTCDERRSGGFFNRAWLDFTGLPVESQRDGGWLDFLHPDDRAAFSAAVAGLFTGAGHFQTECRMRRNDGEYRWLLVSAVRTDGPTGVSSHGGLGTCIDITDAKRMTERQSLLMRELDHRVKNNLAAVASVADLTFLAAPDSGAFRQAFQGRLAAMGRAHSALAAGRWTGLDLDTLVRTVLRPVMDLDSNPVKIEGPRARIPQEGVPAMAMAFHELTTNAQKYGALSVPGGRVSVRWWWPATGGVSNDIMIEWKEQGGPAPRPQPSQGLGLSLLRGFIESELAGELSTDFHPSGLTCMMKVRTDAWEPAKTAAAKDSTSVSALQPAGRTA